MVVEIEEAMENESDEFFDVPVRAKVRINITNQRWRIKKKRRKKK